ASASPAASTPAPTPAPDPAAAVGPAAAEQDATQNGGRRVDPAGPTRPAAGGAEPVDVVAGLGQRLLAELLGPVEQVGRLGRVLLEALLGLLEQPQRLRDPGTGATRDGTPAGGDGLVDAAQPRPDPLYPLGEVP